MEDEGVDSLQQGLLLAAWQKRVHKRLSQHRQGVPTAETPIGHPGRDEILVGKRRATDARVVGAESQRQTGSPQLEQRVRRALRRFGHGRISIADNFPIRRGTQFQADSSVSKSSGQLPMAADGQTVPDTVRVQVIRRLPNRIGLLAFSRVDGERKADFERGQELMGNLLRTRSRFVAGQVETHDEIAQFALRADRQVDHLRQRVAIPAVANDDEPNHRPAGIW